MSKERELLQALKDSIEADPYQAADVSQEVASQGAAAAQHSASSAGALDLNSALDFFATMGSSMANDPMFYLKVTGVLILTVIIIMVATEMIAGS